MQSLLDRRAARRIMRAALLILLLTPFAFARPASAAGLGAQRVIAVSATNSNASKSATAACPSGKKVIGTGGNINGEVGPIVLTSIAPNAELTSVKVTASETGGGTASKWSVAAVAICANPPSGLQRVSETGTENSDSAKLVNAVCPSGQKVLGSGATVKGVSGGVASLTVLIPTTSQRAVLVGAAETGDGTTKSWSVRADAICANESALPGYQIVEVRSADGSSATQGATAICPSGKQVLSAGGFVEGPAGLVTVFGINPDSALTRVSVTGIEIAGGTPFNRNTSAVATCASP
jgi:hypothetical protein